MKVKEGYILKKVMGSYMIISTVDESSSMQTLNETGAFLWEHLTNDTNADMLCEKLTAEYDVDMETAKKDVEAFLSALEKSNLLEK
ncbi:MAG: PqqD family protein [Clostridia bacterium]